MRDTALNREGEDNAGQAHARADRDGDEVDPDAGSRPSATKQQREVAGQQHDARRRSAMGRSPTRANGSAERHARRGPGDGHHPEHDAGGQRAAAGDTLHPGRQEGGHADQQPARQQGGAVGGQKQRAAE